MLLTFEPALYFRDELGERFNKHKGIGIRIKDFVFITDICCEVLTSDDPKEIHEIEKIMTTLLHK